MQKVAVIDIGSNTIKLLVASGETSIISHRESVEESRISKGISADRPYLTKESMERGLTAVGNLITIAETEGAERFQIVATSAVRDALNGQEFSQQIFEKTGHPVKILSGLEEAGFIANGLRFDPELTHLHNYIHFDLGGGSLECNLIRDKNLSFACSMPLGAVRVTEQWVSDALNPFTKPEASAIDTHVQRVFRDFGVPSSLATEPMVFTGGSATISRALIHHRSIKSEPLGPNVIKFSELENLLIQLAPLDFEGRLNQFEYLPKNRADVVCAAIQVLISTMNLQKKDFFQHSMFSLRHGIAANLLGLV